MVLYLTALQVPCSGKKKSGNPSNPQEAPRRTPLCPLGTFLACITHESRSEAIKAALQPPSWSMIVATGGRPAATFSVRRHRYTCVAVGGVAQLVRAADS